MLYENKGSQGQTRDLAAQKVAGGKLFCAHKWYKCVSASMVGHQKCQFSRDRVCPIPVTTLENLETDRVRYKEPIMRTITLVRLSPLTTALISQVTAAMTQYGEMMVSGLKEVSVSSGPKLADRALGFTFLELG